MIERVLPEPVATAEVFGDVDGAGLFPAERALVARAVRSRQREFATGRYCARRALAGLGLPARPLLWGTKGAPLWPEAVRGSITHCAGYRAAAVVHLSRMASVGIDAEPHHPLPEGVLGAVARPAEEARIAQLALREPEVHWGRLLFSAKESVYKAWYPLTGLPLRFGQVRVDWFPDRQEFTAHVAPVPDASTRDGGPAPRELSGRWLVERGIVVTAVTVPGQRGPVPGGPARQSYLPGLLEREGRRHGGSPDAPPSGVSDACRSE
ncbi:hypothetical protein AR457_29475 [Streptomyces agglomeratus]|uniref:4'-phosphopantetheinyl transferase n=1 Tax=Streptomyces agglomeratus TaxID=285458 RepID=A0A1E5PEL8_9ACTN|nr:4'-phosphopantetheinyl transferase superfamily protein [Streptomyces agglomeratus]OEJ27990.1 hypothetical protein AS594_29360 [Streptomyces agglomeratus]OEJ37949.1 hypothetical protein BGK70_07175 [Streptomyces agglomeratus]OEJ47669.1 hypothetical protein AR457_29475 [Streptomyces agglomeratus]OEJ50477.1 hypothetical protein BGK72_06650 [Streptomyces agglomeratus]